MIDEVGMAWQVLRNPDYDRIWNPFQDQFGFDTDVTGEAGIFEPSPSITYSVGSLFSTDGALYHLHCQEINRIALAAFRNCVEVGGRMFVFDWQHECYSFYPHISPDADEVQKWPVCVLPYGDFYIFLSEDLSFGTFGHPWAETVCVFGEQLLRELENNLPQSFHEIRRK